MDAFKGSNPYGGQPFLLQIGDIVKKIFYIITSIGLFIVLIALSIVSIIRSNDLSETKLELENSMKSSLQEAVSDMRTLENDLSKLMITTNEKITTQLLSAVSLKSAACGQALSKLPIVATGVQDTLKFTNQLSSYCVTVLNGEKLPDNFDRQITDFFDTCQKVNGELNKVENDVITRKISLLTVNNGETESEGIFGSIDNKILEYPSVIFDGPFSDGQERNTPKEQKQEISADKAIEYVKNLGFDCEYKGEMNGVVPVYTFESDKMNLQVTKNGGMLLMAISDRYIEEAIISEEEAEEKALAFVEKLQIGKVKNVWQEFYGNYAIFNFAPAIEDTVLYPDIFKVKVALDNGDIIAFEGKNYVMNNHKRTLERATVSFKEAEKKLKEGFKTETSRLCLISVNEKEQLCYEFFGKFNDLDFAVYISAIDGEEKTSFRIISTETGKMVA